MINTIFNAPLINNLQAAAAPHMQAINATPDTAVIGIFLTLMTIAAAASIGAALHFLSKIFK